MSHCPPRKKARSYRSPSPSNVPVSDVTPGEESNNKPSASPDLTPLTNQEELARAQKIAKTAVSSSYVSYHPRSYQIKWIRADGE
ncbi:hypothetical protein Pst134EB_016144 [Puccinia striiformis f. sp. tritici]|nr:hypothetical protein Pst134EB_016144 [Puccinia striiformis f. sp. tritici]